MSIEKELASHKAIEDYLELMIGRRIGHESAKTYIANVQSGFFDKYLSGCKILEIGHRGAEGTQPTIKHAIGVDVDYPGYDGIRLPFDEASQDAVYSSHCLEHIDDDVNAIRDWFRVIKIGGYLVLTVPHQFLYEKRKVLNHAFTSHKRFYTPAKLVEMIEAALAPNSYRLRSLRDNDMFYDYSINPNNHAVGCYEIELVLQKIEPPYWGLL